MSFPRYPKYKPSGVEWLGDVPEGWEVAPLKFVATYNDDVIDETTPPDTEIIYVDISAVDALDGIKMKEPMLFGAAPSRARRRVKHGDTIVSTVRTYLRAIARVRTPEENLIVSTGFAVIRPRADLSPDYVGNVLSASYFIEQVIARSTGVGYPAINASDLARIPVAIPPLAEQTAIAEFLDRETGKIDGLVAEQRRLMELLKEKRQAVISHAVTKGLNPHAPMKPSGIEWLGDVADGWDVMPLKHLCVLLKDGTHLPPERVTDGIPLLSVRNLVAGKFVRRDDDSMISEENYRELARAFVPYPEDVLLAIVGATLGKTAIIPIGLGLFHIQRSVAIFRTKLKLLHSVFLNLVFQSRGFQALLWELVGYSAQPGIYLGTLQNIRIPVPPLNEQVAIAAFLDAELAKFDTLTAEAQRAIDLLQERRTALISAAVTGQIDVRQQPRN